MRDLLALAPNDPQIEQLLNATADRTHQPTPLEAYASAAITPYLIAAIIEHRAAKTSALIVVPDDRAARDLTADLTVWLGGRAVHHYPSRGVLYESHLRPPPHLTGLRIAALDALDAAATAGHDDAGTPPAVVVASIAALSEKIADRSLRPHGFQISRGDLLDLDDTANQLVAAGYERVDRVEERGQFAVRGDILDLFSTAAPHPTRVELFDIEVESIREFSTFTQRSLDAIEVLQVGAAAELAAEHRRELTESADIAQILPLEKFEPVLSSVPPDTFCAVVDATEVEPTLTDIWTDVTATFHDQEAHGLYSTPASLMSEILGRASIQIGHLAADQQIQIRAERPHAMARSLDTAEQELEKLVRSGYRTVVAWNRQSEAERAGWNLARLRPEDLPDRASLASTQPALFFQHAFLREGFIAPTLKLAVLPDHRLLRRSRAGVGQKQTGSRGVIRSFSDLNVGDVVVHEDHGIARFAGFETKTVADITRDYLTLEYRGEDRVFLPADQLHKIGRYFGAGADGEVKLSKLGGKAWETLVARARRSAHELAGELVNLYAERKTRVGHAFTADSDWQHQFEEAFPYNETADQLGAIDQVKDDMEAPRPMDRLICGDVGYGKTEVALRAAFKAVQDGKQVMVLAPTTVLVQQHLGTFTERMRDFPVRVDAVSRFRTQAQIKAALAEFADGKVDVMVGTHRLLSKDVRPKDLGLIVIDEEQRFGVRQKELLRQLRLKVDVLTLSATPIPRTLQMSLAGMRDISVIETPPEGRKPVKTYVGEYDEDLIGQALKREHNRGGQSIYLHDRVESIEERAEQLRALCPELNFDVAHGQLDEKLLEPRVLAFMRGEGDCLVCTTIVESGLDIATANTLVVERADRLGLAQMYQIRGRVGRSRDRAFAYMLYPSSSGLTESASARLAALSDYTELGSGFKIAMRDLEIRGAGSLLGDEQSGHIAAVGFDLYVSLIDAAVAEMTSDEGGAGDAVIDRPDPVRLDVSIDAYVPGPYAGYEQAKIEIHRRVAGANEIAQLVSLRADLEDRFGPIPEPLDNLIKLQEIRLKFGRAGARSVGLRSGRTTATPVQLNSAGFGALRQTHPGIGYESSTKTISLRLSDQSDRAALSATVDLADHVLLHSASALSANDELSAPC